MHFNSIAIHDETVLLYGAQRRTGSEGSGDDEAGGVREHEGYDLEALDISSEKQ